MRRTSIIAITAAGALALSGCAGTPESASAPRSGSDVSAATSSAARSSSGAVTEGVYRYEVTEEHLTKGGVRPAQAAQEHGVHTVTMTGGQYSDSWRNTTTTKTCRGTYSWEGSRITVRWTTGCTGDWAMTAQASGDQVRWTEIESLPPEDDAYAQALNEAFNSTLWTRVGGAEDAAGS